MKRATQAEASHYTLSPTQPMSYLIGKLEILKLIDEYKKRSTILSSPVGLCCHG
jgi:uncharacterized protein (DUF885 family)